MAQRIKVQDGKVYYSASDPADDVTVDVAGQVNVTKQVTIGNDPVAAGIVRTGPDSGADLIFRTNTNGVVSGNIKFEPHASGSILFNNVAWPDGTVIPVPGMFLGVSDVNTLQFLVPPGDSGTISAPINEVVYGTGTSVTTDTDFVYNSTISTLSVGSAGTGEIKSNTGDALIVDGNLALVLKSSTGSIDLQSELLAGSLSGTAGKVLTSQGPGQPPTWSQPVSPPAAAAYDSSAFIFSGFSYLDGFDDNLSRDQEFTTNPVPYAVWEDYDQVIRFTTKGFYLVTCSCQLEQPISLLDNTIAYGSRFTNYNGSGTVFPANETQHTRTVGSVLPYTNAQFDSSVSQYVKANKNIISWTDTYMMRMDTDDSVSPRMYGYAYDTSVSTEIYFKMAVIVQKVTDYPV